VMNEGGRLHEPAPLDELRGRRRADLDRLHPGVRRLVNPHRYHVSLTPALHERRQHLAAEARAD